MGGSVGAAREEGRNLESGWALAGEKASARGRADGGGGVGLGEAGTFAGKLVEVRRLLVLAAEAAKIVDAEIICEENDEVGLGLLRPGRDEREQSDE